MDGLGDLQHSFRERHHVQVDISTSGASNHEVPAANVSRREVAAGFVNQARDVFSFSVTPPSPFLLSKGGGKGRATSSY